MASLKVLASGEWNPGTVSKISKWTVGQQVNVQPRTWAGINRPGGHGTISKINYNNAGEAVSLDVKYTIGRGHDHHLGLHLVESWSEPDRRERRRGKAPEASPVPAVDLNKENDFTQDTKNQTKQKKLTGRRRSIAENLKRLAARRRTVPVTTPPATPDTKQTKIIEEPQRVSVPDEICFQDSDACSVISDLEDDGGIEDSSEHSQHALSPDERNQLCKRWSLFVGSIAHNNIGASRTVASEAQSRASKPPVSVTRSLVSGHFHRTRHTKIASGVFERQPNKRKSPPALESRPPLPQLKRKGNTSNSSPASPMLPNTGNSGMSITGRFNRVGKATHMKTLEDVWKTEKDSANQFINQVVCPPVSADDMESIHDNAIAVKDTFLSIENSDVTQLKNFFVTLLNELLRNDDDMLEEAVLFESINNLATKRSHLNKSSLPSHFDAALVEKFLVELTNEDKIMRSDGLIYCI